MPHRLAIRCDGDPTIGAGHVARCLPLARAFADRGWEVRFAGSYAGLAAWLLRDWETGPFEGDAAIVDSYSIPSEEICELPMPFATLAEASRCPNRGVWIDYHLDRSDDAPTDRLLPGPAFAPVDPRFAGAGRAGHEVKAALLTFGGSEAGRALAPALAGKVREVFGDVRVLTGGGAVVEGAEPLPSPSSLLEVVGEVDVAVTAGGLTAYELACAGLPSVVVELAENQRRVVEGLLGAGVAAGTVEELQDPQRRARMRAAAMEIVDGRGAARATTALLERWPLG